MPGRTDQIPEGIDRVVRGGSFSREESKVRSAFRDDYLPKSRSYNLSFRIVRTIR